MKVKDIMTEDPFCCEPDTPLVDAAKMMVELQCGALPVVADLRSRKPLIGIITDRDMVCRTLALEKNPMEMSVKECMSYPVISVKPSDDAEHCRFIMEDNLIRRVPAVDDTGFVCGLVTQAHIARHFSTDKAGDTVRKISQPGGAPSRIASV